MDLVRGMVQKFRQEQYKQMGEDDTKYAWFSIPELISFLSQLQLKYQANGCRIYLGTVTQNVIDASQRTDRQQYLNKLTMIFVGTKTRIDGANEFEDDIMSNEPTAYDFGTLCPPGLNHDTIDFNKSIHKQVYGN
jgi:hypothetical protein